MDFHYTAEKNHQILIALLKKKNIRYIVASPGTTNISFVSSVQSDPFFKVYSSVDERSAAYMACGIVAETQEPVVLSCTGATASRNYYPGLTEAFYRKLPIVAVTSTQLLSRVGHHHAQVIDRSVVAKDVVCYNTTLQVVKDADDFQVCEQKVNEGLLTMEQEGRPIHFNLETTYSRNYFVKELPHVHEVRYYTPTSELPEIEATRVGIFIGAHSPMTLELTAAIDHFCALYDGAVIADHTSGYDGKYKVQAALIGAQEAYAVGSLLPDLTIHMGEVSGDYDGVRLVSKRVWRVSADGCIRNTFGMLEGVFGMEPQQFFERYIQKAECKHPSVQHTEYLRLLRKEEESIRADVPQSLPFSNVWIAQRMSECISKGASVHLAILNSLRAWNMFRLPKGVHSFSNVGGFGIDGCLSTALGASIASPDRLTYLVIGDLAFFYDMNALGNRHLGCNMRILLVNNGVGTEFKNYNHRAADFKADADAYMAAKGHYGQQSPMLIRHYADGLGLEYHSASNKDEFMDILPRFVAPEIGQRSILLEVFTSDADESNALKMIKHVRESEKSRLIKSALPFLQRTLGERHFNQLKHFVKKLNLTWLR